MNPAPVGIFDSGIGGLTVARAIYERLPHESTIYFGDTARVPYGPKSPETVTRYSLEILDWLLKQGVKAVVIACNTSTAHALESRLVSLAAAHDLLTLDAWEGTTLAMSLKTRHELAYLRRTNSARAEDKRREHEDWLVLLAFNHLFAGLEAFVSAHLADFPGDLRFQAVPGGVGASVSLPIRLR